MTPFALLDRSNFKFNQSRQYLIVHEDIMNMTTSNVAHVPSLIKDGVLISFNLGLYSCIQCKYKNTRMSLSKPIPGQQEAVKINQVANAKV